MNVHELEFKNFMSHAHTRATIGQGKVTIITGANGAGKSALVEAASVCLWGKTLRGTPPWSTDAGEVRGVFELPSGMLEVTRTKAKARVLVRWEHAGVPSPIFDTTTKAQEALEKIVGPWDVWRRASVFSSADAAHFTLATDAERKRLLENILGIDRFDTALEQCRADLRAREAARVLSSSRVARASDLAASEERREREAREQLVLTKDAPVAIDPVVHAANVKRLRALIRSGADTAVNVRAALRTVDTAAGQHTAMLAQVEQTLQRLRAASCPTCTQAITPAVRVPHEAHAAELERKIAAAQATGKVERGQLEEQLAELGEETAALETQLRKAEQNAATAAAMATSIARSQAVLADATVKAAALRVEAKKIESEMLKHDAGIEELAAVEKVLGLKGVRAHVLGSALFGLEAVANAWLSRISGGGLTVKVTPYTEKKTGGVSDSISIDVEGAGNGHGYRAASGGERKRIDIALLLALGDIAAAAHGHKPGTIFCDEIGDTLDAPAVLALSKALQDIARGGRAVVVISHSSDLQRTLQADARWSVDAGVLSTH